MPPILLAPVAILRTQPVGDSDLIVSLLSPARGRIDAVARAARSSKKRFVNVIRPFCSLSVLLEAPRRGTLPSLAGAELLADLLGDQVDYPQLCLASYLTELAAQVAQPEHADPALFQWLVTHLGWCAVPLDDGLAALKAAADASFLQVLGLLPDLQRCARCGSLLQDWATWPADAQGLLCQRCAGASRDHVPVGTLAVLAWAAAGRERQAALAVSASGQSLCEDRLQRLLRQAVPTPQKAEKALRAVMLGVY